ncbi:MAG TPA: adenylate kinase [Acidimicrobiales bacterium]|nr:adenylate kinase [Acidimicrobiales bacterium]
MRIVLLGAPGSGKGTQGPRLAERLGVPYLSTGDLLRAEAAAGTELGARVKPYLEDGELVPDDLTLEVVDRALADASAAGGFVLDGFPRTVPQADRVGDVDVVLHLALSDDVARQRLAARDEGRADDADPEVIEHRLRVYHGQTAPLLDHYDRRGTLVTVDADRAPAEVAAELDAALDAVTHRTAG